jgi:fructan beta-fructosidase
MAIYTELHRPQFHFSAKKNWINDPNGLVYRDGIWHLFFQHNRLAPVWGEMSWGHAVSDDLLHWRELEIALEPDDMGDMFSGSAVVDEHNTAGFGAGALLAFYTAAGFADKPTASLKRVPNGAHTQPPRSR